MSGIQNLILDEPPLQTGATAMYPSSPALKKQFSVTSRFGEPVQLWDESPDGKWLFLPRAVCPPPIKDMRTDGYPIKLKCKVPPKHEEQAKVISEIVDLLRDGQSHLFQARAGFGKTYVGCNVLTQMDTTTLIVCTKEDLIGQWRKRLQQFTNILPSEIGLIQQDTCDVWGKKVVLASVHSLAIIGRYPPSIRKAFGLVIFDECHRLGAETFSRVCSLFAASLRLGMSATPQRVDGKEIVFQAHIGPIRVKALEQPMPPKVLRYITGWDCPRWKVNGEIRKLPHSPAKCGHVLKYLIKDKVRNALILSLITACYRNKRRLVVFSDVVEHLELLESMAKSAGVPIAEIGRYYGTMKPKDMDASLARRVIFATPGKMGEGTDAPWLDACILATPKSNIEQIVGRVLREYENKPQPVIFDLCDMDSPVFKGYAANRAKYYHSVKSVIKEMQVEAGATA